MSEWWSYSLSDLLMFSPRVYYRLFEGFNTAFWLPNLVLLACGIVFALLVWRRIGLAGRLVPGMLAIMWAWVAWGFLWRYYTPVNLAAPWMVGLFAVQVGVLIGHAVRPKDLVFAWRGDFSSFVGAGMLFAAIVVWPLAAPLSGRAWQGAELFGSAPDPTIIGTLGMILLARGTWRWTLLPVPVAWCLISSATLWVMDQDIAWVMLVVAWLSVLGGWMDQKNGVTRGRLP
ncbi:DUF6064 family protein [Thalassospira sp.]|uniref:DUF6064 family protein n=1 Tax=Thalassospira sp. TaxID=1912094 RepID=UPI0027335E47|nr:DUF6064 family protein [Thalassospira sp.]MDP2699716.1 DUF6064 family protein [Thalassospira sp.]